MNIFIVSGYYSYTFFHCLRVNQYRLLISVKNVFRVKQSDSLPKDTEV